MRLLSADPARGTVAVLREDTDARWLDIVAGVPGWTGDGRIVWTADSDGTKRLLVAAPAELADGTAAPVTPPGLQVREVADIDGDTVLFTASGEDPDRRGPVDLRPTGPGQDHPGARRLMRGGALAAPPCSSAGRWTRRASG